MNLYNTFNNHTYPSELGTNRIGNVSDYPAKDGFALGLCGKEIASGVMCGSLVIRSQ